MRVQRAGELHRSRASDQREEFALGFGVAVDVPLGRLDRSMPSQQLNVVQQCPSLMHNPRRPSDERAANDTSSLRGRQRETP
jgi:hypothetical protein